jgi:peptide/nickel transport system permease protein
MRGYLLRRILALLPTLVGISLVAFLILNLIPADPILTWSLGGAPPSAEALERLRAELGADRGPVARYADWSLGVLRGDLGRSLRDGRPVTAVIAEALPWSLLLNACALLAIYGLAVPYGLLGGAAPGSAADRIGTALLLLLYALPSFAAALLLQQLFAVRLGLLPLHGAASLAAGDDPLARAADLLRHLILPTACLALGGWAFVARYARAAFRSEFGRAFLAVARAKGVTPWRASWHVAANAAVPLATLLGAVIPGLVGGSVIVEQIFSWPGIGRLYVGSVEARDYPVVLGLTLLSGACVLAGQFLVDLLYLVVDPRIRRRMSGPSTDE